MYAENTTSTGFPFLNSVTYILGMIIINSYMVIDLILNTNKLYVPLIGICES